MQPWLVSMRWQNRALLHAYTAGIGSDGYEAKPGSVFRLTEFSVNNDTDPTLDSTISAPAGQLVGGRLGTGGSALSEDEIFATAVELCISQKIPQVQR
jgi:hypothetical protein